MYSNYGYGGGGMGGGSSSSMMSSAVVSSMCMSALAGGAYWYMNKTTAPPPTLAPVVSTEAETASSAAAATGGSAAGYLSGLDGAYTVMVGSVYMTAPSSCGQTAVLFKSTNDNRTTWKVRKATVLADGTEAYTLQSDLRSFNKVCQKTYLTAPAGCRGPPFLSSATRPSLSQLWIFRGSDKGAVEIQNAECKMGRYTKQWLMNAGQVGKGKVAAPAFDARGGSTFSMMAPMG